MSTITRLFPQQPSKAKDDLLGLVVLAALWGLVLGGALTLLALLVQTPDGPAKTAYGILTCGAWMAVVLDFLVLRKLWQRVSQTVH